MKAIVSITKKNELMGIPNAKRDPKAYAGLIVRRTGISYWYDVFKYDKDSKHLINPTNKQHIVPKTDEEGSVITMITGKEDASEQEWKIVYVDSLNKTESEEGEKGF